MRLNAEDRRFRFFAEPPEFMIALHAGAAVSDGRAVLACESEGEIRGAGELLTDRAIPVLGELAFSIEHDWRRQGLGSALMGEMITLARNKRLSRLELEILPDNRAMQAMARRYASRLEERDGNVIATIDLSPRAR
jgi:GNAT superfamily N-acetyltransferase